MSEFLSEKLVRSWFEFIISKANTCLYRMNKQKRVKDCCQSGETLN